MDQDSILDILGSGGSELETLKENLDQLMGFLALVETVDKLPEMDRRVSEDGLSLYHAVSKEIEITDLQTTLSPFFGEPVKHAKEPLPDELADNLTINYLGGVKKDQVLFLKRIGQGEMYAALFPWQRKANVITVHLGLYNPIMPDEDYERLDNLVTECITQRVSEELEGSLAGKVQGISLPSFLQMSEMENSTCSLRISSGDKTGMMHLLNGTLIDAETGGLKQKDAAYTILSWDNPGIEILKAVGRTKNEINLPLMHLLMDSLSQKDQREYEETAELEREKLAAHDAASEPKLEMLDPAVEPDRAETVIEKESPGEKTVGPPEESPPESPEKELPAEKPAEPVEALPPEPPQKPSQADDVIDDALIQKDAPKKVKRRVAKKTAAAKIPQKKMGVAAILVVLVLCVAGYFIFQKTMGEPQVSDFDQVIKKVSQLKDADAQEKLLMDFINTHESEEDIALAEMKLQEIWLQNEEANYQKTIDAANKLPVDQDFEKNAKALYSQFLEKYPNSSHKQEIKQAITEISGLTEDILFSNLKGLGEKEYTQKIRSYENYLSLYPKGKYRESVKKMFSGTLGESYMNFKRDVAVCERAATWDACLTLCDDYRSTFSNYLDMSEVETIRKRIQMEKDYVEVKTRVAGVDDDIARPLYMAYMKTYPDSANNEAIQKEIQRMDQGVTAERDWKTLKKSINGSGLRLQAKIDNLEKYISRNNRSPYVTEAREILKNLEKEAAQRSAKREQSIKSLNAEEKAKKEAEEAYAVLLKLQAESARINAEKQKALSSLDKAEGRFAPMGDSSVKDQRTGLVWSLLDSQRELGVCMDYRAAKRYVRELRYDGHDDWRLPTAAELAGIYKNKPYFPDSGAEWYWTGDVFAKGYSYIVNTVTAKQETVFKKIPQDVEACGTVRAVRP
jgi:Protein of unknown function (DUF1566)/Domain of unknown function (DUF4388)